MQIRDQLTLLFLLIVALIMGVSSIAIYYSSSEYRREEFYARIESKARNVAKLLIEVDEVDTQLLMKIEQDNPISLPNEEISIFDYQNNEMYRSEGQRNIDIDQQLLNRIRLEGEVRYGDGDQEVLGFLFADKYDRVVVVGSATDYYGFRKMNNLRNVLVIVFGSGLLFTFISGRIFASRALSPISRVVSQVANISINSLNARLDEGNRKDEIARLAGTFNQMLDRLEAAFKLQKNFIANASHELRTPLTAITGQLEVTLINERSNKDYRQTMESVLDDMQSLNYLSNRLLLLAQAGSETIERSFEEIRVDELVWQSVNELQKRNVGYRISVQFAQDIEDVHLTVKGHEQLIKTAILNLLDNGCKYSNPSEVLADVSVVGTFLIIAFSDKGIGIDDSDAKLVFQPFYRGSNVDHVKGHGIGLSLVEQIVKLHKGSLQLVSEIGKGSTFTISFPIWKAI